MKELFFLITILIATTVGMLIAIDLIESIQARTYCKEKGYVAGTMYNIEPGYVKCWKYEYVKHEKQRVVDLIRYEK